MPKEFLGSVNICLYFLKLLAYIQSVSNERIGQSQSYDVFKVKFQFNHQFLYNCIKMRLCYNETIFHVSVSNDLKSHLRQLLDALKTLIYEKVSDVKYRHE